MMEQGKLIATQNHKGNVVLEVELVGKRPVSVPKQGRAEPQVLLQHHEKNVQVERSDNGSFVLVQAGEIVLFSKGRVPQQHFSKPAQSSQSNAAPANRVGVSLQTISQQRAKHALEAVNEWKKQDEAVQKKLKTYVVSMPAMILMSGFGQTCAFYKSKDDDHAMVLGALEKWLKKGDIIEFIPQASAQSYQLAQAESLEYLNWLKKFVKAYLKGDE